MITLKTVEGTLLETKGVFYTIIDNFGVEFYDENHKLCSVHIHGVEKLLFRDMEKDLKDSYKDLAQEALKLLKEPEHRQGTVKFLEDIASGKVEVGRD